MSLTYITDVDYLQTEQLLMLEVFFIETTLHKKRLHKSN